MLQLKKNQQYDKINMKTSKNNFRDKLKKKKFSLQKKEHFFLFYQIEKKPPKLNKLVLGVNY